MDALATRRAKHVGQDDQAWRQAIWGETFQKLTQSMTDGEVETFVGYCMSAKHLEAIARHIVQLCEHNQVPPFAVIQQTAEKQGLSALLWFLKFNEGRAAK